MSPRNRASLFFLLFVFGTGAFTAVAAACGPEAGVEAPPPNTPKPKGSDKTEVTMQATPIDPSASAPNSTTTATPTSSSATTTTTAANDPSDDPNIGGVQEPAVEKAVAPTRPRLRACYKKALAVEPNTGGSSTFDITIGNGGKVATVRFVKRNGLNEDMVGCLLPAIKAMTFDGTQKSQILTLSFGTPPPSTNPSTDAGAAPKR